MGRELGCGAQDLEMFGWMMSRADVGADGETGRGGGKGGEKEDHSENCHACGRMGSSWV